MGCFWRAEGLCCTLGGVRCGQRCHHGVCSRQKRKQIAADSCPAPMPMPAATPVPASGSQPGLELWPWDMQKCPLCADLNLPLVKDTAATVPSIHSLCPSLPNTRNASGLSANSHLQKYFSLSPTVACSSLCCPCCVAVCSFVQGVAAAQAGISVVQPNVGRTRDWYNKNPGVIRDPHVSTIKYHTHSGLACGVAAAAVAWLLVEVCSTTACYALRCSHASFSYTQQTSCCCAPAGVRLTSTPIAF
jgi:hypothetical protein